MYGGLNYPFLSTSVAYGATNVALKSSIEASSNTVIIYGDLNNNELFGARSLLSFALYNIFPTDNLINSIFSYCNNTIEISSYTNVKGIYGANFYLDPKDNVTLTSSIYLDNNYILFNSSATVTENVYAASLALYQVSGSNSNIFNLAYVSLSNNTVEIKENINCGAISTARLHFAELSDSQTIEDLSITNNKIILSKDALDLSTTALSAYLNYYNVDVNNANISNNTLQINNAKNVLVGSIHNFDTFSFNLPTNLSNYNTILTLISQPQEDNILVDAHKLFIYNYDHHTSTLTVNLIDALSAGGPIDLSNTNGSYLYDHTRTQLEVKNNKLIFTFDPTIAPSPA
ncbi:MAG: DUF3352 domain-containing protein, partial [Endomicrobium sp.]|nr:DUF3352 domain-containing protein [Endomicrobium sp.]